MNFAQAWIVKRFLQGVLIKSYGPFREREEADRVALAAFEKHAVGLHTRTVVEVEPVHPATVGAR